MVAEKWFSRAQLRADFLADSFGEIEDVTVEVPGDGSRDSAEFKVGVVAKAFRRAPRWGRATPVAGIDIVFHVDVGADPANPLMVTPRSRITDSKGKIFQVSDCDFQSFETRWRCNCARV